MLLKAAWLAGSHQAGRTLVRALGSADESTRVTAGILLSRSGSAAVPVLREGIAHREGLPEALTLLANQDDPSVELEIRAFLDDSDPVVSRGARRALDVFKRRTTHGRPTGTPETPACRV